MLLLATILCVVATAAGLKHVVVVGGGWAGYSAADALSASPDVRVTLLEASPRAAGGLAAGWRTPQGRPIEAGIHGFWREYANTFRVIDSLGLDRDAVLTPYTPSVLASKSGRVAVAPVLATSGTARPSLTPPLTVEALLQQVSELLPAPLDTALLAEFAPSSPLTFTDRASAIGLLACWADFAQEDPAAWARYDQLSAEALFKEYGGVTDTLYEELVEPLLHVLPMAPGYDISAGAALSCFHVFALQSRGAFDVRWCRGAISEKIFAPWQRRLEERGNVELRGGARVSSIEQCSGGGLEVGVLDAVQPILADAVILAVGGTSAARLAAQSPVLRAAPPAKDFALLRGITCVAARLYLRPSGEATTGLRGGAHSATLLPAEVAKAMEDSPVLVVGPGVGGIPALAETGFCVYDLQRMQDELSAGDVAVLEVDFYRADAIADMKDDQAVAALALQAAAAALGVSPALLSPSLLVDVAVVRARNAVSHFSPGSAAFSPDVRLADGLYACGDWVDRTGHASWSTEKAVVTGRQAAGRLGKELGLRSVDAAVIPAAADTAQLAALRRIASTLRSVAPPNAGIPPPAPWALLRSLMPWQ